MLLLYLWGESKILLGKGGENLRSNDFDDSNFFSKWKKPSVNIEHQLKSKLYSMTCVSWNQNKNGTGAMTTAKNDVFIVL